MMTDDQLQFIDYRKPKLEAGEYSISVTHSFDNPKNQLLEREDQAEKEPLETTTMNLLVAGQRVSVGDEVIFAQYPPQGESGDFRDTLPHISFKQPTLPWLRSAYDYEQGSDAVESYEPWMYLMNVHDGDIQEGLATSVEPCLIKDLRADGAYFPVAQHKSLMTDITLNNADTSAEDRVVQTITITKSLFEKLIWKDKSQNDYLSHVRRRWQKETEYELNDDLQNAISTLNDQFETPRKAGEDSRIYLNATLRDQLKLPDSALKIDQLVNDSSWLVNDPQNGDLLLDKEEVDGRAILKVSSLKRELSVVMSNRFVQADSQLFPSGMRNYSHVVSLEGYLKEEDRAAIETLSDDTMMRFIVLTSWWFNCTSEKINFKQRSEALEVNSLRMPMDKIAELRRTGGEDFIDRLNAGYVALPHRYRKGDQSLSWYRGPFVPNDVASIDNISLSNNELSIIGGEQVATDADIGGEQVATDADIGGEQVATDADRLLCYFEADGMFDISYASAYELGRMLSFKNSKFSQALAQYKRAKARYINLEKSDEERRKAVGKTGLYIETLPYAQLVPEAAEAQLNIIKSWLINLASFEPLPRWNLIADPELLPKKTLRTFRVDPKWVQSLWLGALSLNGRAEITTNLFKSLYEDASMREKIPEYGAILRSDIVWAYPELQAKFRNIGDESVIAKIDLAFLKGEEGDGYTGVIEKCLEKEIMYEQRLDRESCLYLTKQGFDYVSLSLPPESLHYGANFNSNIKISAFTKSVKFAGKTVTELTVPMRDDEKAIVDMEILAERIVGKLISPVVSEEFETSLQSDGFKSARMSRFMLEGEPQVEFTVGDEKKSGDK